MHKSAYLIALFSILPTQARAASLQDEAALLASKLSAQGYTVLSGSAMIFGAAECQAILPVTGSCSGTNPAAPYILPLIPSRPGEYLDPNPLSSTLPNGQRVSSSFRLDGSEGLIILADLPPEAAYFGYQSYVASRATQSGRANLAASIGNSINDAVIARQLGVAWGNRVVITTSANSLFPNDVKSARAAAGQALTNVFSEPVGVDPSNPRVHVGLDQPADSLEILVRYALPHDATSGQAWRDSVAQHVIVLRAYAASNPTQPNANPKLDNRTAVSEQSLESLRDELVSALRKSLAVPAAASSNIFTAPTWLVGPLCIAMGISCAGDTQDTDTYRFASIGMLESNEVALVVGVDHSLTGNAKYISIAVTDANVQAGVVGISKTGPGAGFQAGSLKNAPEIVNTLGITGLSPALQAALPNFYVALIARDCGTLPGCTVVPDGAAADRPFVLPVADQIQLVERAYVRPGTLRGANPASLVSPAVVQWAR